MSKSLSCVAISGLNFPYRSRKYLINLVGEVVRHYKAKFIVIAGNVLAGKELEKELKGRLASAWDAAKAENLTREKGDKLNKDEVCATERAIFIQEMVGALDEFLPVLTGVNYHIVAAVKVYDGILGWEILEKIAAVRDDIRVFDDPETKIPINIPGFGDMRVLVPRKNPWLSENITQVPQRLMNIFAAKTKSPAPSLVITGCSGTASFIPRYMQGVPIIAAPDLNVIDDQNSTENLIGCSVVTITKKDEKKFQIAWEPWDFRTAVFNELEFALPENLSKNHRVVLNVLKSGSKSLKTVQFRINQLVRSPWLIEKTEKYLEELRKARLVTFNKSQNRFALSEALGKQADISLFDFLKDGQTITTVDKSCVHAGSLKTTYFTLCELIPEMALNADAIISNGDLTQGVSHNYAHNGELVPTLNGPDKHQILAGLMDADTIFEIFKKRWRARKNDKRPVVELIKSSIILFLYKYGNHDEERFSQSKDTINLFVYDRVLREKTLELIVDFIEKEEVKGVGFKVIQGAVEEKIVRVGESRIAKINGVPVGIKHPFQSRTASKSTRIQQTVKFFAAWVREWAQSERNKGLKNISIVKVANFHENTAVIASAFGKSVIGTMTGAQTVDTLFESDQNKVVDHGFARTSVTLNKDGDLLMAKVEYFDDIVDEDRKFIFKDKITTEDVADLALRLAKKFNMPWR